MAYQEGTNGIPKELEDRLLEAKTWYDKHAPGLDGWSADEIRNSSSEGADILMDIVETVDRTWGFA